MAAGKKPAGRPRSRVDQPAPKLVRSFAIDPDLAEKLEEFVARQKVRVSKSAVIETAVRDFLERHAG